MNASGRQDRSPGQEAQDVHRRTVTFERQKERFEDQKERFEGQEERLGRQKERFERIGAPRVYKWAFRAYKIDLVACAPSSIASRWARDVVEAPD